MFSHLFSHTFPLWKGENVAFDSLFISQRNFKAKNINAKNFTEDNQSLFKFNATQVFIKFKYNTMEKVKFVMKLCEQTV